MRVHRFYKEGLNWYIDLPEYLEQGGTKGDLQMIDGTDKMLDLMSQGTGSITLQISTEPFKNADVLVLEEVCDPFIGGGNYYMELFEGTEVKQRMWLCSVTEFVFGNLPGKIYVKILTYTHP